MKLYGSSYSNFVAKVPSKFCLCAISDVSTCSFIFYEKIRILIKKHKNIKIENVRQNLQVIKDLVRDLVVANQQRDREMKQLKEFVAQLVITMQAHITNEQLHPTLTENSPTSMGVRRETGFSKTGRKISSYFNRYNFFYNSRIA